jgi:hypothetical protein
LFINKEWDDLVGVATPAYNHFVHASTEFTQFELAISRIPMERLRPLAIVIPRFLKTEVKGLTGIFAGSRCEAFRRFSGEEFAPVGEVQENIRSQGVVSSQILAVGRLCASSHVYSEHARSPKLSFPVAGPYPVIGIDGTYAVVRTRDGIQRHHLDRIIRAPIFEFPPGV